MVAIPSNEVAEGIFKAICYICLIAAVCFLPSVVIVSLFEQRRLAKQRQRNLRLSPRTGPDCHDSRALERLPVREE